jgi:hypothetical protein
VFAGSLLPAWLLLLHAALTAPEGRAIAMLMLGFSQMAAAMAYVSMRWSLESRSAD